MEFGEMLFVYLFFTIHGGAFYIFPLSMIFFPDHIAKGFFIICVIRLILYFLLGPLVFGVEVVMEILSVFLIWPRVDGFQTKNANKKKEQTALAGNNVDINTLNAQKELYKNKVLEYADAFMLKNLPKLEKICTSSMYNNISLQYDSLAKYKRIKIFEITDIKDMIFSEYNDNKVTLSFNGKGCDYTLLYDGRPFGNSSYKDKVYNVELVKEGNDWLINSLS